MGLVSEFKEFAMKGNVVDLAVGVIIGAAFGKIVSSLVTDVVMPPLGLVVGGLDFSAQKVVLKDALVEGAKVVKPETAIYYGRFFNNVIDFMIVAFAIFIMIKMINRLKRAPAPAPAVPPPPTKEELLLTDIRDILKNRNA